MEKAVKIAVRRRPLTAKEASHKENFVEIDQLEDKILMIDGRYDFIFDQIFKPSVTQEAIYDDLMKPMVEKFMDGFNCTLLVYGQTGTGKTYTMGLESEASDEANNGMIPRALADIFCLCQNQTLEDVATTISVSFIEIHTEKVHDLLSNNSDVPIYMKGQSTKYEGPSMSRVCSLIEAQQVLAEGAKKRQVRHTELNSKSSRSHAVFTIKTEKHSGNMKKETSLHLVDLAGSEGIRRTNHQGAARNEGVLINQGLLSMSNVIRALSKQAKVIPYRESVLTTVLQDSLNDKSYLTLLACISPMQKDLSETMSTLRFAREAKTIKVTPQMNMAITTHKKTKTPVKFKTPLPRMPIAQSTALKRPHVPMRSVPATLSNRYSYCPSSQKKPRFLNRVNSLDDSNRTFTDTVQAMHSGCSTLEMSTQSITPEPVRPISAIQHLQQTDQPTSMSPTIRRVVQEEMAKFSETVKANIENITMVRQGKEPPVSKPYQTIQPIANLSPIAPKSSRNAGSDSERTILIPAEMDETFIAPKEPEDISAIENEPDTIIENSAQNPKATIVYPYDSSTEYSTVVENSTNEMNLTNQSVPSSINIAPSSSISNTDNTTNDNARCSFAVPHRGRFQRIAIPNVSIILPASPVKRRSPRLSVLYVQKQAQLLEKTTSNETAKAQNRPTIARRGPGRPRKADKVQVLAEKAKNAPKARIPSNSILQATNVVSNVAESCNNAKMAHRQKILRILNEGDLNEIQKLPQIGAKTASSLHMHRQLNGEFENIESMAVLRFWSGKRFERFLDCNNLR